MAWILKTIKVSVKLRLNSFFETQIEILREAFMGITSKLSNLEEVYVSHHIHHLFKRPNSFINVMTKISKEYSFLQRFDTFRFWEKKFEKTFMFNWSGFIFEFRYIIYRIFYSRMRICFGLERREMLEITEEGAVRYPLFTLSGISRSNYWLCGQEEE